MLQIDLQELVSRQTFYFFINTKSGNREGQQIMSYRGVHFDNHLGGNNKVRLNFVDLFNNNNRISEIENLRQAAREEKTMVKVIICGGDGTISWVLNDLIKNQVDLTKCVFGIIPIGTGNDFCRTIGWPSQSFDFRLQNFLLQLKKWMNATISKYDIWDVSIQTYNNGKIYDIKDCKQFQMSETTIKKAFSNYVGMGLDARVVYTVQKIRTPFAFFNKILYGIVGCLNFFRPMKDLRKKLLCFTENASELVCINNTENTAGNWLEDDLKTTKTVQTERQNNVIYSLKKNYKGFVCLNCTSYMAGLRDVWETRVLSTSEDPTDKQFTSQSYNDGKIEFVAFRSELGLALQRCLRSGARITQGGGPFEIVLKETEQDEITYMQIDGQSIKISNLKSIRIARTDSTPDHQINIMIESIL